VRGYRIGLRLKVCERNLAADQCVQLRSHLGAGHRVPIFAATVVTAAIVLLLGLVRQQFEHSGIEPFVLSILFHFLPLSPYCREISVAWQLAKKLNGKSKSSTFLVTRILARTDQVPFHSPLLTALKNSITD
jgi:hypothetical protein